MSSVPENLKAFAIEKLAPQGGEITFRTCGADSLSVQVEYADGWRQGVVVRSDDALFRRAVEALIHARTTHLEGRAKKPKRAA